ncbi:hypothetical protein ACJX0J_031795, partial [Zea mays]
EWALSILHMDDSRESDNFGRVARSENSHILYIYKDRSAIHLSINIIQGHMIIIRITPKDISLSISDTHFVESVIVHIFTMILSSTDGVVKGILLWLTSTLVTIDNHENMTTIFLGMLTHMHKCEGHVGVSTREKRWKKKG